MSKNAQHPFEWISCSRLKDSSKNAWSTIALGFHLFSPFVNCSIGDGSNTYFWEDAWVGRGETSVCLVYSSLSFF